MTRIFVSALALIGASTATAAAATFTAKVQVPSKLLDIRGGAGPRAGDGCAVLLRVDHGVGTGAVFGCGGAEPFYAEKACG